MLNFKNNFWKIWFGNYNYTNKERERKRMISTEEGVKSQKTSIRFRIYIFIQNAQKFCKVFIVFSSCKLAATFWTFNALGDPDPRTRKPSWRSKGWGQKTLASDHRYKVSVVDPDPAASKYLFGSRFESLRQKLKI